MPKHIFYGISTYPKGVLQIFLLANWTRILGINVCVLFLSSHSFYLFKQNCHCHFHRFFSWKYCTSLDSRSLVRCHWEDVVFKSICWALSRWAHNHAATRFRTNCESEAEIPSRLRPPLGNSPRRDPKSSDAEAWRTSGSDLVAPLCGSVDQGKVKAVEAG